MIPSKLLVFVLVAAGLRPVDSKLNHRQVVGEIVTQLRPAIQRALASLRMRTSSPDYAGYSDQTNYNSYNDYNEYNELSRSSQRVRGPYIIREGASDSAPTDLVPPSLVLKKVRRLSSSVVEQLRPSIAAAVTKLRYQNDNQHNQYLDSVSYNEPQSYVAHEETRSGGNLIGSYKYVDPSSGSAFTFNYEDRIPAEDLPPTAQFDAAQVLRPIDPAPAREFMVTAPTRDVMVIAPARSTMVTPEAEGLVRSIISHLMPSMRRAVNKALYSRN